MFERAPRLTTPARLTGLAIVAVLLLVPGVSSPAAAMSAVARAAPSLSKSAGLDAVVPAPATTAPSPTTPGSSRSPVKSPTAHPAAAVAGLSGASELSIDNLQLAVASSGGPMDSTGAVGANRGLYHTIGEQRSISPHVVHALATQDTAELGLAMKGIEYSFAHQQPDGSFQVVQFAGASFTLATYDPVGVDFFMADLGHSLMLFAESGWFQNSPASSSLRQRLDALRPRIALSLQWLSQPPQVAAIQRNGGDTNRLATASAAFVLVGRWLGNPLASQIGASMTQAVIAREGPDGVLPENGGYDSMYQSVSLHHLSWIYLHLGSAQASLRAALGQAISRGLARERQSIQPSGQILTAGNTRVFCGGESFRGTAKGGDYRDVVLSLLYGSVIGDTAGNLQLARAVAAYYFQHAPPAAC